MRQLLFPAVLGFISAIPFLLVGSTLQAWGTADGLTLMTLGCLTLIGQPYAFKFLWAPLVDRFSIPFFRGHRRSWMLLMMLLLAIIFFLISLTHLPHQLFWFVSWALIAAFCSSTLDIAVDAYRTEQLPKELYGLGNASYVSAYRIGALVSGGLALILADQVGWQLTYQCMAVLILIGFLVTFFVPENEDNFQTSPLQSNSWKEQFIAPIKNLWQQECIVAMIIFIVLYKFGEAMGTALTSTFLLRGLQFSLTVLGTAYKTVALFATVLGAFIGGYLYKKYSLYATLLGFGILQALGILLFASLAVIGKNLTLMIICITFEFLTGGMATAVFLSFLMKLCRQPYTATHFALLSACASLGRIFTGPLASACVKHFNWEGYFIISFFTCIPGLVMLKFIKPYLNRL